LYFVVFNAGLATDIKVDAFIQNITF